MNIFLKSIKKIIFTIIKKFIKIFYPLKNFLIIVEKLIRKEAFGIYNVSMGKKYI